MSLQRYQSKRDLTKSPEPAADSSSGDQVLRFVVHKHSASHLHYDFRLELDGVLKSWAIPKGPSLDPSIKRLAMMVEDHPYEYRNFEGVIPKGNYGAGEVVIWDEGTYRAKADGDKQASEDLLREGLRKGDLKFVLQGHKLNGEFALVRMKSEKDNTWLLLKKKDEYATEDDVTLQDSSVVSKLTIDDLRRANPSRPPRDEPSAKQPDQSEQSEKPVGVPVPMPHNLKPMLATSFAEPFDDPDWLFEIKLDGYRCIAEIAGGEVLLYSRNNISFNQRFTGIVRALEALSVQAVFDGEIVALDEKGRSYFQLLQNHQRTGQGNICYFLFDLLYLNGEDLRTLPLLIRKQMLRELLPDLPEIKYSDHIVEYGKDFFELARTNNLEGILAKHSSSQYQTGRRSKEWLKIKIRFEQEAVICGFTQPRGSRKNLGSLVLGVYENKELVFIGLTGGGFDESGLQDMHARLEPLVQPDSPFKARVKTDMPVKWVQPVLVCQVEFSEWTDERLMRQPIFLGLREDKDPQEVVREQYSSQAQPVAQIDEPAKEYSQAPKPKVKDEIDKDKVLVIGGNKLELTNLDKVFWPEEGYTKGDVIDYYRKVAASMLPHLKDRPESLYRTPHGITEKGFFQKEAGELPPAWIKTKEIFSKHVDKNIKFFVCQDEATLVYMANLGCIEINPWLSRLQSLDSPDYFVVDLDPEDIAFEKVIETALAVHEVLEKAGAASFPKTSGATGIHIYVPLGARYDYQTAQDFAHLVATMAHHMLPEFTSLVRNPQRRQQKVYLDFLQNKAGQTLAAPYSIRPRPGATVSAPLDWKEVKPGLEPGQFTIKTMPGRLQRLGDIFRGVLGPGIDIEACIKRLESG
jgi:bifunctional non-homologous end joining protein LigD